MSKKKPVKNPEASGLEDIKIDYAPKELSEDEIESLLRQDVRIDFHKIARSLEDFHGIFAQMWDMGYPDLTWQIPTAAVRFNKNFNRVDFLFNPIAWRDLDLYTKSFVVGHECLHAVLNHGMRAKDCPLPELANIAMDIVVNHILVSKFGFSRACIDLSPLVKGKTKEDGSPILTKNDRDEDIFLCWIDTVFGSKSGEVKRNKNFEYYYALLEENIIFSKDGKGMKLRIKGTGGCNGNEEESGGNVLDEHDTLEDFDDEDVKKSISDNINDKLTEEEKKDFSDKVMKSEDGKAAEKSSQDKNKIDKTGGKHAGSIGGRISYRPDARNVIAKRKWETVIRNWARKHMTDEAVAEQWARKSRRMASFPGDLIVPHELSNDEKDIQKIDVMFFLDVSGSCWHLKDRFFKAAASLPKDRFNVSLYCFDTEVHKIDTKNPEIKGGGGTAFDVLEEEVQRKVKMGEMSKYPDSIWVITDGYGNKINPEKPEKWFWFLSCDYKEYLPKKSNIYMLEDFE